MGSKRLDSISDYARHGYVLRVDCRACGHIAKLDPAPIGADAVARNKPRGIAAIQQRLKCSRCGKREVECGPAFA